MTDELKPCPFCGSTNIKRPIGEQGFICRLCGSEIFGDWNSRPAEDALRAAIAEKDKRIAELERDLKGAQDVIDWDEQEMREYLAGFKRDTEEPLKQQIAEKDAEIAKMRDHIASLQVDHLDWLRGYSEGGFMQWRDPELNK